MRKILLYIFSQTKLGQMLDGKKTYLGAVFVLLAAALQVFENLAPLFPDVPFLIQAAQQTHGILTEVAVFLNDLGLGFLTVGVLHKTAKANEKKKE
jgi:hypothetical protein